MAIKNKKKEQKKQREESKIEVKKACKSNVGFNIFLYFILVVVIISFVVLYLNFHISNVGEVAEERSQVIARTDNNNLRSELNNLKNKIQILEERVINAQNEANILKSRVENYELEIGKIQINTQRIDLIRLVLNIQKYVELGQNYTNILNSFKNLMGENNDLESELDILLKYQNSFVSKQILENDFNEEMNEFVKQNNLLNNKSEFSNFMSKFVVVRKVKDADENSADDFINQLEQNIKMQNYIEALRIVESNEEYSKYFSGTIGNIKVNILVNNVIQDIIDYLVNN